jgi:tetratricopeptide (TPR) repeat protein
LLLALSRLAFDRGDPVVALDHARSAVECDPESGEAWQVYAQRARHLERLEDVAELAEQLTRQRPWNAMIWLRLAEVRHLESENQASIEALQRALERRPDLFEALDTYAEALTRIGRPQEALAVCERSLANYFEQGALRARRAWVLWQFERRDQALAAMRSVLEHHPDQTWGLQELVTWEQELEHTREAVELAQRLVERAPLRAVSHGFLGDALLASSDEQGAWQAFSRAARLDPAYSFAGSQRIRIALNGRRFEDARSVIAEQGEHVSPATRDYWELTVACREQDVGEALAALARLAKRPNTSAAALRSAGDLLAELPHAELSRPLLALATDPSAHPEMGAVWVASLQGTASAPSSWAIRRLAEHPPAMVAAVREHFEALGSASAPASSVLWALLWLGRVARGSDLIWGKVGFALMSARAYVCCELWLSDYRRRRDVEAWMLLNLSYAALENHRTRAALQAAEHALTLPTDDTLQQHLTFAAFGRAVAGDVAGARELFAGRDGTGFGESHAKLFHATGLLLELVATERHERHVVLQQLGGLDLSRSGLKGADMRSGGTLQRMLAAGVLKQGFVFGFFVMRWLPWLVALALGLGLTFGDADVAAYCGFALVALPVAYLVWRHSS